MMTANKTRIGFILAIIGYIIVFAYLPSQWCKMKAYGMVLYLNGDGHGYYYVPFVIGHGWFYISLLETCNLLLRAICIICILINIIAIIHTSRTVSYTHLTLPTN